jgi:hypothetical protein
MRSVAKCSSRCVKWKTERLEGALISIDPNRTRLRVLPLRGKG